jgi:hypothetical protein
VGLIYLDTCLVIYLAERHARWGESVADAMARATVLQRAYTELFAFFVTLAMPEPV